MAILERIANKIAGKRDILTPRDWKGEDLASWIVTGVLRQAGFAPEDYICTGCTACDAFPCPKQKRATGGEPAFYVRCAETGELMDVPSESIAKYAIKVESFAALFASALQCQKTRPSYELHGVWDLGETGEAFSNRKRRAWFFRRFDSTAAQSFKSLPSGSQGAIIVAAKVGKDYDESAFPFVFAASELMPDGEPVVSLDPVRIRFMADTDRRRQEKMNLRKPDTDLEDKLKALAQYYKDNALALARVMKKSWHKAESAAKKITQQTAADAVGVTDSRISEYLNNEKYETRYPWAKAARFWQGMCADPQQLSIVADIIRTRLHHKLATIDKMDAVALHAMILPHFLADSILKIGATTLHSQ
ncbi:MAG: hypothetical protein IKO72_06615 [Kiritimatiellae bacterium]|nr:hypothetical protein [Kiritimatiellia bacterium]